MKEKPRIVRVYVAGPYSVGDKRTNAIDALNHGNILMDAGMMPFVPHLTHWWDEVCPGREYGEWLAWDLAWLPFCNALLRLPGPSLGADLEVLKAEEWSLPIYSDTATLIQDYNQGNLG